MKKIQKIYITCCKRDLHLTKICVSSIRYWYPQIPILLVKDYTSKFSTREIEKFWNVSVLNTHNRKWRFFTKLEPFFLDKNEKVLVLDSDIILVGKLLQTLEEFEEEFIVSGTSVEDSDAGWIKKFYLDVNLIQKDFDDKYVFPGFVFNSGQLVVTCGKITKNDFAGIVNFNEPFGIIRKDMFTCFDQSALNYVLVKKMQKNEITLKSFSFKTRASDTEKINSYSLSKIITKEGYPALIHWMKDKAKTFEDIKNVPRSDLLLFYQEFYNSNLFSKHNWINWLICFLNIPYHNKL